MSKKSFDKTKRQEISRMAVSFTQDNEDQIVHSDMRNGHEICGCACCGKIFKTTDITKFENSSAICPNCGIKAIIPGGMGIELDYKVLKTYSRMIGTCIAGDADSSDDYEAVFPSHIIAFVNTTIQSKKKRETA